MAIYLLDTSVIIDALNRKRGRWEFLAKLVEAGETLACSAVTVMEIYAGMRSHEAAGTESFLDGLEHYGVDRELARYAGMLKNEWARKGRTLSAPDVLIAATALAHRLVLMTDNRKDFPMASLALYPLP
ncbi:MAG TPA: type II toxin-antitoxin system VapC family toxin [Bryobacteraceae bacterium]|nr:type II toxin-antitoxin system VapC family toxin [Bryobacteraceae bacterium]